MKTLIIDRNKFKTELGRKLYDYLKPLATNEEWLYLMCMFANSDIKRKKVFDFINEGNKSLREISDFIVDSFAEEHQKQFL